MGKKRFFLLCVLILLSSCAAPVATVEIPSPSITVESPIPSISAAASPTETHTELPPEPSATPITVDLTATLADAEGKDIDLWRGDLGVDFLDDCPGIKEYTGFDDGTGSIRNLTHYSRRYLDGYCYESFLCTDGNYMDGGHNTVIIPTPGRGTAFGKCSGLTPWYPPNCGTRRSPLRT